MSTVKGFRKVRQMVRAALAFPVGRQKATFLVYHFRQKVRHAIVAFIFLPYSHTFCFCSPTDGATGSVTQLTIAFNFFVHGESTVCASIDIRQHPPVYRISKSHFLAAQGSQRGLNGKPRLVRTYVCSDANWLPVSLLAQ